MSESDLSLAGASVAISSKPGSRDSRRNSSRGGEDSLTAAVEAARQTSSLDDSGDDATHRLTEQHIKEEREPISFKALAKERKDRWVKP